MMLRRFFEKAGIRVPYRAVFSASVMLALLGFSIISVLAPADAKALWLAHSDQTSRKTDGPILNAAFPDGLDTRRIIDGNQAPFVAMLGQQTRDRGWLARANGFQVMNNRIIVMPIHAVFTANGKFITREGMLSTARGRPLRVEVRFRVCADQVYFVDRVFDHGDYTSPKDIGNDWLVGILDRPTCIDKKHIPQVLRLTREYEENYLLPNDYFEPASGQLKAQMFAETAIQDLQNTDLIARNAQTNGKLKIWSYEDSRLTEATGYIDGELHYRLIPGTDTLKSVDRSEWVPDKIGTGRVLTTRIPHTKGNSGAPVVARGSVQVNGKTLQVEGIVGMVVADSNNGQLSENFLTPLRNRFFDAIIKAYRLTSQ